MAAVHVAAIEKPGGIPNPKLIPEAIVSWAAPQNIPRQPERPSRGQPENEAGDACHMGYG